MSPLELLHPPLEEALRNSNWRIGRSQKLASENEALNELSQALLMRQARMQNP